MLCLRNLREYTKTATVRIENSQPQIQEKTLFYKKRHEISLSPYTSQKFGFLNESRLGLTGTLQTLEGRKHRNNIRLLGLSPKAFSGVIYNDSVWPEFDLEKIAKLHVKTEKMLVLPGKNSIKVCSP